MCIRDNTRPLFCCLLLALVLTAFPQIANACSCAFLSNCEYDAYAEVVFTGTIVDVSVVKNDNAEYIDRDFRHRVQVNEAFRGIQAGSFVEVFTDAASSCSFEMKKGTTYLILANMNKETGRLWTGMCSGTAPADGGNELYAYFREQTSKGTLGTLQVTGNVTMSDSGSLTPAEKIEITPDQGEPFIVAVGEDGSFRVPNTRAGRYRFVPILPPGYIYQVRGTFGPWGEEEEPGLVEVRGHGCTNVQISVKINGKISGRLLDSEGKPIPELYGIDLLRIGSLSEDDREGVESESTDADGNFSFEALPPGRYVIGMHLDSYLSESSDDFSYPRFYYPNSDNIQGATVLELGSSAEIKGLILQTPPRFKKALVKGRIVGEDGKFISGAEADYYFVRDGKSNWGGKIKLTDKGHFGLEVFEGTKYVIVARNRIPLEPDSWLITKTSACVEVTYKDRERPLIVRIEDGTSNCDLEKYK